MHEVCLLSVTSQEVPLFASKSSSCLTVAIIQNSLISANVIYHKLNGMKLSLDNCRLPLYQEQLVQPFLNIIHLNIKHLLISQYSPSLRYLMKNKTDIIMFPNLEVISVGLLSYLSISELLDVDLDPFFCDNLKLVTSQRKLLKLEWHLDLKALIDDVYLDCFNDIEVVEMEMNIINDSNIDIVMLNLDDCPYPWAFYPDMFTAALAKHTNCFSKLYAVRIYFEIFYLEFQYIHNLFQALYNSSFYNIVQSFVMLDKRNKLHVELLSLHSDKTSWIARIESNPESDDHHSDNRRTLYLTSELLFEDWYTTNFYLSFGVVSDRNTQFCTNRKIHTYFS